jgi:hypothetical protein
MGSVLDLEIRWLIFLPRLACTRHAVDRRRRRETIDGGSVSKGWGGVNGKCPQIVYAEGIAIRSGEGREGGSEGFAEVGTQSVMETE